MEIDSALAGLIFGFKKATLLAGAAGILFGIVYRRQFKWVEAISAAFAGGACVLLVVPVVLRWAGLAGIDEYERLGSWLAGMCGMYVVDFIFAAARDPWGFWRRFRNGGRDDQPGPGSAGGGGVA